MSFLSSSDVERFRRIVGGRLGLRFDDSGLGQLADVLGRRLKARDQVCGPYLEQLESQQPAGGELGAIASELTVGETYFFRNPDHFRALAEVAVPARMRARHITRSLQVLAAGCASGEEAYTLAIVLRESANLSWHLPIRAVDINPAMIQKARRARYSAWSLRGTDVALTRRWFTQVDREFALDNAVRSAVVFEERNLAEEDGELWKADSYDIVFCRNVLMYFEPEAAQAVVKRIAGSLFPGGYLFLGHAETLRGLSQDFHLEHTHGTFYYRRRTTIEDQERGFQGGACLASQAMHLSERPALSAIVERADTWVEAIRSSSDRILNLTRPPAGPVVPDTASFEKADWDLGRSLELLQNERFGDALASVQTLPPESARDPEVLLLRAVLLTHSGQLGDAETMCSELLEIDELNSGAHYLLALCREGVGDPTGAVEQDQIAVYLDPSFAMPRLHLGLIARRAGDAVSALREFEEALLLLQREDTSRLLMFGGGFGRDALITLCRVEIAGGGGRTQ